MEESEIKSLGRIRCYMDLQKVVARLDNVHEHHPIETKANLCKRAFHESSNALRDHLEMVDFCADCLLLAAKAGRANNESKALTVTAHLLARFAGDLSGVKLLAEHGFAMQSMSLAAAAYETAVTIISIGNSDDAANLWLQHADETRTINTVKQLSTDAEVKLGLKKSFLHNIYSRLCMFKHVNPIVQKPAGFVACEDHGRAIAFFPTAEPYEIFRSGQALSSVGLLSVFVIASYAGDHLTDSEKEDVDFLVTEIEKKLAVINAKADED